MCCACKAHEAVWANFFAKKELVCFSKIKEKRMPEDLLTKYLGHRCAKCGQEEREVNKKWGVQCNTASQRWQEQNAQAMWLEEYNYVPYAVRHPETTPPPAPTFKPQGACPRCGGSIWIDRSEGQWGCGSCGLDPQRPAAEKPV
jgi:ribosomal protein S27AE